MKRLISNMFHSKNMSFLSLKSTKKNALIDFLSVLPEISTTATTVDSLGGVSSFLGLPPKVSPCSNVQIRCRRPVADTVVSDAVILPPCPCVVCVDDDNFFHVDDDDDNEG